jgi:uncharacterized protein with beta-barrel porin domain
MHKSFKRNLLAAVSLAALPISWARADDLTISTGTGTAVTTSSAKNSSAGNISITANGSVSIADKTVAAVTINSNNTVTNLGTISNGISQQGIAVLLKGGGASAALSNSDIIYATGTSDTNIAIEVDSSGFTGNISLLAKSDVEADGDNSIGIAISGPWTGTLDNAGKITVSGNDVIGVDFAAAAASSTFTNSGTIDAEGTYLSNFATKARAISFDAGNTLPAFTNASGGTVEANTTGKGDNGGTAIAIFSAAGSQFTTLTNAGTISAYAYTSKPGVATLYSYAIQDLSGNLTSVNNSGTISATATTLSNGAQVTVAADLSHGTSNITFANSGTITGKILFGGGSDTLNMTAGTITGDISFGAGDDTVNMSGGTITGNMSLADGNDSIALSLGTLTGDVSFGTGANTLTISGGTLSGIVNATGGTLDIAVTNGTLQTSSTTATTLNVGTNGTLTLVLGSQAPSSGIIYTSGNMTLATGAKITLGFNGALPASGTYTLLSSGGTLTMDTATATGISVPWLYTGSFTETTNALQFSFQRKSASAIGLSGDLATIYTPALTAAGKDDAVGAALMNISSTSQATAAFSQFLPDLTGATRATAISLTDRNLDPVGVRQRELLSKNPGTRIGVWGQEYGYSLNQSADGVINGYTGHVVGFSLGMDKNAGGGARLGAALTVAGVSIKDHGVSTGKTTGEWYLGTLYENWRQGDFFINGQGKLGIGQFDGSRTVALSSVTRVTDGSWWGYLASAGLSTGAVWNAGDFAITPELGIDGMFVREGAYAEKQGGSGVMLSLDARDQASVRGSASVTVNDTFTLDDNSLLRPYMRAGVSYDAISKGGTISGSFTNVAGTDFSFNQADQGSATLSGATGVSLTYSNWAAQLDYVYSVADKSRNQGVMVRFSGSL